MTIHKLKITPLMLTAKQCGNKNWELRLNDRDYQKNDVLDYGDYQEQVKWILFDSDFEGLKKNWCLMTTEKVNTK